MRKTRGPMGRRSLTLRSKNKIASDEGEISQPNRRKATPNHSCGWPTLPMIDGTDTKLN